MEACSHFLHATRSTLLATGFSISPEDGNGSHWYDRAGSASSSVHSSNHARSPSQFSTSNAQAAQVARPVILNRVRTKIPSLKGPWSCISGPRSRHRCRPLPTVHGVEETVVRTTSARLSRSQPRTACAGRLRRFSPLIGSSSSSSCDRLPVGFRRMRMERAERRSRRDAGAAVTRSAPITCSMRCGEGSTVRSIRQTSPCSCSSVEGECSDGIFGCSRPGLSSAKHRFFSKSSPLSFSKSPLSPPRDTFSVSISSAVAASWRLKATIDAETASSLGADVATDESNDEQEDVVPDGSSSPSFSMAGISLSSDELQIFNPLGDRGDRTRKDINSSSGAPLIVYVPGLDGTGQFIRSQVDLFRLQGYDLRCVHIPASNRSNWSELVGQMVSAVRRLATDELSENDEARRLEELVEGRVDHGLRYRHVTLVGESFGACLSLRVALAAPTLISRLVLINPATNFAENNRLAGIFAVTGVLQAFPDVLYTAAQEFMLPLLARKSRVSRDANDDLMSIVDYIPTSCATWRLSLLLDESNLSDNDLRTIEQPTLLIVSGKDRVLPSLEEGGRLQKLIQNAKRAVLPESGHFILLEEGMDLSNVMIRNGFFVPAMAAKKAEEADKLLGSWKNLEPEVPDETMDELGRLLAPWRFLTSPCVSGEENLPNRYIQQDKPLLFVGNHTLFGSYDTPILFHELFLRGYRLRGLAHRGHWLIPQVGDLFERYGNIKATPLAAYRLLKKGECVLLFPGGSREVCKKKGEKYKLIWKEQTDFVRMAAKFGAIIVPFAALGGDDAYKLLFDRDEIMASPIRPLVDTLLQRSGLSYDDVHPVTALPGTNIPSLFPIPSVERIYFHFMEPIDTSEFDSLVRDPEQCKNIYERVKRSVEAGIDHLQKVRDNDPERELGARLTNKVLRLLPDLNPFQSSFLRKKD